MNKITIVDINESYSKITFDDLSDPMPTKRLLDKMLSVHVLNYQFSPQYRSGVWDGLKRFYHIVDDYMLVPRGLVLSIVNHLRKHEYDVTYTTTPFEQITRDELTQFIENLNLPFKPYDYQFEYIYNSINEGRNIGVSSTSSGKSVMIYIIMMYMVSKHRKSVLIVPSISLVSQMYSDFKSYNIKDDVTVHKITAGCAKNFDSMITITTWQSIYKSTELFKDVDCIIVDEVHGAKGESLQKIMQSSINTRYKFGVTGTLPRPIDEKMTIVSAFGKTRKVITPMQLIDYGLATPIEIKMLYCLYHEEDILSAGKMDYQQEKHFIEHHINRNEYVAKITNTISKQSGNTFVMFGTVEHGKFLLSLILSDRYNISVDNVKVLEKISSKEIYETYNKNKHNLKNSLFFYNGVFGDEEIAKVKGFLNSRIKSIKNKIQSGEKFSITEKKEMEYFLENIEKDMELFISRFRSLTDDDVYIVYGKIEPEQREEIRKLLEAKTDAIVLGSFKTMSTGVSVKRLHNIILAASTKSYITLNQIIGRLMRLYDGKEVAKLIDIVDDLTIKKKNDNVMLKHSNERIEIYYENEYPITSSEVYIQSDEDLKANNTISVWQ